MTEDVFFILGYLLLILILWLIPYIRTLLLHHKPEIFGFSSGYIFLLADIKSTNETIVIFSKTWKESNTTLVSIGVLFGLISIVLSAYEKSKLKKLKEVSEELNKSKTKLNKIKNEYYNLCSDSIKEIFKTFYATANGNGRVSLYKHDGNSFMLLGRATDNPDHNKTGLETYPDNEGFIALGWQQGAFEIHNIPKWTGKIGTEYRNFMKANCVISDERLKKLTMRSRSFYVYSFRNTNAQNPYGIIVFEKMSETQIQTELIDTIFQTHASQIITLLKSMKSLYKNIN
ncbi:MAG: hypothetical protein EBZ58_09875 [Bacteroidetes bacterium]|nr:hypothetical protein [Bacteroidota bacterium]